jgi:transcriptional regulator with XRE-family HTH domain
MKYLKYWRYVAGKTQEQVAKEVGISQGHYCEIEKRGIKPRPEHYTAIAEAIRRPVEEVVARLHNADMGQMASPGSNAR